MRILVKNRSPFPLAYDDFADFLSKNRRKDYLLTFYAIPFNLSYYFPTSPMKTLKIIILVFMAAAGQELQAQEKKDIAKEISLEQIGTWCNRQKIRFQRDDANARITINNVGKASLTVIFALDSKTRMLTVVIPIQLDKTTVDRAVLVRAANRLNLGLSMGSFVSHPKGHVYYRATVPTKGFLADLDGIDYLFRLSIGTVEGIKEKFQRVATGKIPPEKIL